jgi:ComF family protein
MERAAMAHDLKLPDLIVPVPLHRRRERWRGFNQAELLAENLGKNLSPGYDIPILKILKRKKFTAPQMKIKNYKEREKNIRSAFILNDPLEVELKNKKILLIDDISTTGSTLLECAKVLKSAGASSVWGMVLARQEYKNHEA